MSAGSAFTLHPQHAEAGQRGGLAPSRAVAAPGVRWFSPNEGLMPEKSPQKPAGKKTGKSLKEKREAKQEKKDSRTGLGR